MRQCCAIGIGGTGGKCLEALTYLAACGIGPGNLTVALLDQDRANGNLARTQRVLELYRRVKTGLRSVENDLGGSHLARTPIEYLSSDLVWTAFENSRCNLDEFFCHTNMTSNAQSLYEGLFDPVTRTLNLGEGFQGRANAGSAVLLACGKTEGLWEELDKLLDSVKRGNDLRIFLFASIFGGTGAAWFPTVGRIIRQKANEKKIEGPEFYLGGALLLPYFCYPPPEQPEDTAVRSEAFLRNAQWSLRYYHGLLNRETIYDQLFLIGWDPLINLGYFDKGGTGQENPPLMPELYSALGAGRFFLSKEVRGKIGRIGRKPNNKITWDSIPRVNEEPFIGGQSAGMETYEVKKALGNLVRFAFAYLTAYYPYFTVDRINEVRNQKWYQELIVRAGCDLAKGESVVLDPLRDFCDGFLKWIASLCYFTGGTKVELFNVGAFAPSPASHQKGMALLFKDPLKFKTEEFSRLVLPGDSAPLYEVFRRLCEAKKQTDVHGFGAFVAELFKLCSIE